MAMFCNNCGKKLEPDAKICPFCGAAAGPRAGQIFDEPAPAAGNTPSSVHTWEPEVPKSKNRRKLFIGAGALLLCCAAALTAALLSGNPKAAVGQAIANSVQSYSDALEAVPLFPFREAVTDQEISQTFFLEVSDISDDFRTDSFHPELLRWLGLRISSDFSRKDRALRFSAAACYDGEDMLRLQLGLRDDAGELYCPELMEDRSLVFSTETLGADLSALGVTNLGDLRFNLFDLAEALQPVKPDKAAALALIQEIEVKKTGKSTVTVNGNGLKCQGYRAVIPQDALKTYLDALEEACEAQDRSGREAVMEILRSTGLAENRLSALEQELLKSLDTASQIRALRDALGDTGDVELDIYLHDGYVAAVKWGGPESNFSAGLYLGGGEAYPNNLGLEVQMDGAALLLSSSGNHTGKDGAFTDTTSLRLQTNGVTVSNFVSDLAYRPDRKSNFTWSLQSGPITLAAKGRALPGADSLDLELDDVTLSAYNEPLISLEAACSIGPYRDGSCGADEKLTLSETEPLSLYMFFLQIDNNFAAWKYRTGARFPVLAPFFRSL